MYRGLKQGEREDDKIQRHVIQSSWELRDGRATPKRAARDAISSTPKFQNKWGSERNIQNDVKDLDDWQGVGSEGHTDACLEFSSPNYLSSVI